MTGSLIWGHHFAMMKFWWYECIYIYTYRYIYNRVICMDFPETYMAYMALFFFAGIFPSFSLCFFQDQRRTLATQGWLESTASGARLWWICSGLWVSASPDAPNGTGIFTYNGCHTFMVIVGKHTSAMEHMGRVIGWCMMNTCCWFYSLLLSEML